MVTMAVNPPIFKIDNYMEDYECDYIIGQAEKAGLFSSQLHIDPETLKSKNYTHKFVGYTSNFENFDLNKDNKLNLPDELQKMAYRINYLYLNHKDIQDIIEKFEIPVSEENGDKYISRLDFDSINHQGMIMYFKDLREHHPHHRDRYSEQVWLSVHRQDDKIFSKLMQRLEIATGLHKEILYGTEPIQVVRYLSHGHYHAHFDSQNQSSFPNFPCCHTLSGGTAENCRICRYMTALVYLNDVPKGGETSFPVADDPNYTHEEFLKRTKGDMYNLSQYCYNGSLVVSPKRGRLVMWYNHHVNEDGLLGILDPYSLHGGCDVIEGEKWIANNWIPAPETPNLLSQNVYKPNKSDMLDSHPFKAIKEDL
ncbi:Transmembrane prolyl 4-hydroxylase [Thelohanellus kitauei]|uniref:Transmembrane prolyl 4-hydroxylase n=1 Tax=Thelohanellus kitauei TaxID=669202 RepID=A0A0C2J936_THEKT|nr:Transmembrane prolyl 4-hydroxylase [Thelohanellus kitauei]